MKHIMLLTCMLFIVCGNLVFAQSQPAMKDVVRQMQGLDEQVIALAQKINNIEDKLSTLKDERQVRLKLLNDPKTTYVSWSVNDQFPIVAPHQPMNNANVHSYVEAVVLAMRRYYAQNRAKVSKDQMGQKMAEELIGLYPEQLINAISEEIMQTDANIRELEKQHLKRQPEQIRKLEEERTRLEKQLNHLMTRQDVKHTQLEKMRGEVINISGTWVTDKGALRMISGAGGGYLLTGSDENLVKGINRDGMKKAYAHKGMIYYTQIGNKNTLEGNLYDIAGYCCGNQGVIEITVINEKRLDVVSRWWKQGIPEKEAKQVHKFVEIWIRQ
jgi:hypothetical protein